MVLLGILKQIKFERFSSTSLIIIIEILTDHLDSSHWYILNINIPALEKFYTARLSPIKTTSQNTNTSAQSNTKMGQIGIVHQGNPHRFLYQVKSKVIFTQGNRESGQL